jgi:integrase
MAIAAALAFECCQRVWDCFGFIDEDGKVDRGIKWADYVPGVSIGLIQSKTGNVVNIPLVELVLGTDDDGLPTREYVQLYPELEEELARTPRTDDWIIVRDERTGQPYTVDYMQKLHRKIRIAAGLPDGMTFTGFRHGGLTEVGDAGNEDVRAISGHTTLEMTTIYNKANEAKARIIAAKRREHIATLTAGEEEES